ncbi:hypothetical protein TVAG_448040 [Trichomonas vaginalis G3]|uniref:Right handed beta helix domain-containing protein n=1 Tax=Trichomonas vaginalis (strain ATCC PRA-98 / G3) TaxID=412133 RepID=A2FQJ4_TRIV3|nr:hypothetical protein TVAGG3_0142370 [Trichomonas vaginalis G3]EAX92807.1 hypothetical protein TVAG_448040 [Trichomonas vaginalis G3]KAI5546674.1 hypothetical protein TVAGG3_0142370 [Trichomonas vaginalis G3]|eukprot:XP_001305737.1 hypothetical protein [Trichomonas vaginalis G3]
MISCFLLSLMYFLQHCLLIKPVIKVIPIRNNGNLHFSWSEFYQDEQNEKISQNEFNTTVYSSSTSYYLKNLIIQNLQSNAICLQNQTSIKFLVESCSLTTIITLVPANFGEITKIWDDTKAGAFWFELQGNSQCIINKCSAYNCYNNIDKSYYYLDGGNFATFRHARNKILSTTIQFCGPEHHGVNAFRSHDTSGNYTGLNITNCKSYNTPMFTVFPSKDDSIKYSLFNGNSAPRTGHRARWGTYTYTSDGPTYGVAVVYDGNFTIDSCYFVNNTANYLICSTHGVYIRFLNSAFVDNENDYIAYANKGNNEYGLFFSKISIQNCYLEGRNAKVTGTGSALISSDNENNPLINSELINQIRNQLRTVPITEAQSIYHLRMKRAHAKY